MNGTTSSLMIQNLGFSNSVSIPRPNDHSEITNFIFITSIKHCQIAACLISDPTNNFMKYFSIGRKKSVFKTIFLCFNYSSVLKDFHHILFKINWTLQILHLNSPLGF